MMKDDFTSAMRRANKLVRAGNPVAATEMIQSALNGAGLRSGTPRASAPRTAQSSLSGGVRETLAGLAAKMPNAGTNGTLSTEPPLPVGARFDGGTFSTTAGSRDYRLYIPTPRSEQPSGLLMMLHGCKQSPVDFAIGTDMNRLAEQHNLIVVYPAQSRGANMQSCWNWFGPTDQHRSKGEPAILAGLAQQLQQEHGIPVNRTFVAGLSAGAAMAVILGRTYPDVFAAVGAHSGLPYKSARDVPSAFAVMGAGVSGAPSVAARPVPTIVFHGTADSTVHASNGQRIAEEAHAGGTEIIDATTVNGRAYTRTTLLSHTGAALVEHWRIDGLGHAWSGGNPAGSYTDTSGPDASAEMVRFFLETFAKGA